MMKLYGALASPYVARVVLAARHKKLDLPLEIPADGLKSPGYLAMNPFGKMPTLEHGGRHVIESEVICEYLEDLHPSRPSCRGCLCPRPRPHREPRGRPLRRSRDQRVVQADEPATRDAAR